MYSKMCAKMRELGASEDEVRQKVLETLALKTTVVSPEHLLERRIPITRTDQAAGEFVVTFARTYHLGFSHGINFGEGINFALTEWYEHGTDAALRLTFLRKPPVRCPTAPAELLQPLEPTECLLLLARCRRHPQTGVLWCATASSLFRLCQSSKWRVWTC